MGGLVGVYLQCGICQPYTLIISAGIPHCAPGDELTHWDRGIPVML